MDEFEIYREIREGNYLKVHDYLLENTSTIYQYYIVKALKECAYKDYTAFATESIQSKHGEKALFHNVLDALYSRDSIYDLDYCHSLKDGLPHLNHFVNVCKHVYTFR